MRAVVLLLVAACGRQNFAALDASKLADAPGDVSLDADLRLPGLIAWYRMDDDPSDGKLDDGAASPHVARCVAGVSCPTQVPGVHGNAVAFDGTQYAIVTYGSWLATPSAYTIAAWMYVDTQVDQVAFAKPFGNQSLDSWDITVWSPSTGTGTCLESVDATVNVESVCGPTLTAARWFHAAARWNGNAKTMFIDGVKVGEKSGAAVSMIDADDLVIGSDENQGSPAYQFHGRLDDVQIYDRALSDAELAMLATP